MINNEKCLTLNLSKEPNLFLLKSYFTLTRPNFIGKFVQKSCTFITVIILEPDNNF